MEILAVNLNWPVIVIVSIVVLALLIFINRRNVKDGKDMKETMNQVDRKPPLDHETTDSKI